MFSVEQEIHPSRVVIDKVHVLRQNPVNHQWRVDNHKEDCTDDFGFWAQEIVVSVNVVQRLLLLLLLTLLITRLNNIAGRFLFQKSPHRIQSKNGKERAEQCEYYHPSTLKKVLIYSD